MREFWKTIKEYDNYKISSHGRVKRISRLLYCGHKGSKPQKLRERILKPFLSWEYRRIRLYHNKQHKDFSIHRLVAQYFVLNLRNKPEVNHRDGNKLNNLFTNLEWVTKRENNKHAYLYGLNRTAPKNGFKTRFKKGHIPWNKGE